MAKLSDQFYTQYSLWSQLFTDQEINSIQDFLTNKIDPAPLSSGLLVFFVVFYRDSNPEKSTEYLKMVANDRIASSKILRYYKYKGDHEQMKEYCLMAIEKGDSLAMYNLGYYYENKGRSVNEMKKYYKMGSENGNCKSMCRLGWHYEHRKINVPKMKKYYHMAIEKGSAAAMNHLGHFYLIYDNLDKAKKYFQMGLKKDNVHSAVGMADVYKKIDDRKNMVKYYLLAWTLTDCSEYGQVVCGLEDEPELVIKCALDFMQEIKTLKSENMALMDKNTKLEEKNKKLSLKIKYAPEGNGFYQSKQHFETLLTE